MSVRLRSLVALLFLLAGVATLVVASPTEVGVSPAEAGDEGTGAPGSGDYDGDGVPDAQDRCRKARDDIYSNYGGTKGPNGCPNFSFSAEFGRDVKLPNRGVDYLFSVTCFPAPCNSKGSFKVSARDAKALGMRSRTLKDTITWKKPKSNDYYSQQLRFRVSRATAAKLNKRKRLKVTLTLDVDVVATPKAEVEGRKLSFKRKTTLIQFKYGRRGVTNVKPECEISEHFLFPARQPLRNLIEDNLGCKLDNVS